MSLLHFVPRSKIAGGEGENTKDFQFIGPTQDNGTSPVTDNHLQIQHISDLIAELNDYHLDMARTMGIRRVIIDLVEIRSQDHSNTHGSIITTAGWDPCDPDEAPDENGNRPCHDHSPDWPPLSDSGSGIDDGQAALAAAFAPYQSGGFYTQTKRTAHLELNKDQFLLLNLNFKSPIGKTSPASVKWTFASEEARKAQGEYVRKDLGKVAFQTDKKSWWVLTGFYTIAQLEEAELPPNTGNNATPKWEEQDKRSQLMAGLFQPNPVLFFLPDGNSDPFYAYINPFRNFVKLSNEENALRHPKDQRALDMTTGDVLTGIWIAPLFKTEVGASWTLYPFLPADGAVTYGGEWNVFDTGDLGIYESMADLNSQEFKKEHINRHATVLMANDAWGGFPGSGGIAGGKYRAASLKLVSIDPYMWLIGTDPFTGDRIIKHDYTDIELNRTNFWGPQLTSERYSSYASFVADITFIDNGYFDDNPDPDGDPIPHPYAKKASVFNVDFDNVTRFLSIRFLTTDDDDAGE